MTQEAAAPQFIDEYIASGSTVPVARQFAAGDELFKVIPKGDAGPSQFTPYWMSRKELDGLSNSANFEQQLGLPLGSHAAKYDVYKIRVKSGESPNVFESKIANTVEGSYITTGGATQSLVLNRSKWDAPQKLSEVIFPPAQ